VVKIFNGFVTAPDILRTRPTAQLYQFYLDASAWPSAPFRSFRSPVPEWIVSGHVVQSLEAVQDGPADAMDELSVDPFFPCLPLETVKLLR
jgi:hypothetical protein